MPCEPPDGNQQSLPVNFPAGVDAGRHDYETLRQAPIHWRIKYAV